MSAPEPVSALQEEASIFPLGDAAVTIDLGNYIDEHLNDKALAIKDWLIDKRINGMLDIIVAYSSVSIFYDPAQIRGGANGCGDTAYSRMARMLEAALLEVKKRFPDAAKPGNNTGANAVDAPEAIGIPVCYEAGFGPDLALLSEVKNLSPGELIELHCSKLYRVYMIGFLPGFSYLGQVDEKLAIPRKAKPVPVLAGGVGIAGSQTGIYPLNSPGGWQIIGRTPVRLFDAYASVPATLKIGDHVRFFPITAEQFREWPQATKAPGDIRCPE